MNEQQQDNIINSVFKKTQKLISTLDSPTLTTTDLDYFHRSSFYFGEKVVDYILSLCRETNNIENPTKGCRASDPKFSASMIEVPFDENFKYFVDELISKGIKNFHIDVGDGSFISRSFSGLDKLRFIKTSHPEIECNVHLMVNDPIAIESEINYIHIR